MGNMETLPTVFLSEGSVNSCSRCNDYLSVGPVKILHNKPICGRCREPEGVPAEFYELLAEYMYFPCRNDRHGCNDMLAWGSVKAHEEKCKFSPVTCPALDCQQKFKHQEIVEHFKQNHKELLVWKINFKIPGPKGPGTRVNKLVMWKNEPYILKIAFTASCCFCELFHWKRPTNKGLTYHVLIQDERECKSMHIKDLPVVQYKTKFHDYSIMTRLQFRTIKEVLNTDAAVCKVHIGQESPKNDAMNENLLSELECPICTDYMKPPIFMCPVGHSICQSCKFNVTKCPCCTVVMKDCRNFALEKISEHVTFPCHYEADGCVFTGNLTSLTVHENKCKYGATNTKRCYINFLTECPWKGALSDMVPHIGDVHPKFHVDIKYPVAIDLKVFSALIAFTQYDSQIFKIQAAIDMTTFGLKLCVNLCRENAARTTSIYQYHINFKDLNDKKRVLNLNNDCILIPHHEGNIDLMNPLIVDQKLIKPFIRDNTLEFQMNIC